jgi:hypothetical protein
MLDVLMDGRHHPASELASLAGIGRSTASAHLGRLAAGGLVLVEPSGRQRRYRLAGPTVARALEELGRLAGAPSSVASLRASTAREQLRAARMCYDHLAGRLGVAVMKALVRRGHLVCREGVYTLLSGPGASLARIGVNLDLLRRGRRPLVLACPDWTEGQPHLAGALGAAICTAFVDSGWVRRMEGLRAVQLTDAGRSALRDRLGMEF